MVAFNHDDSIEKETIFILCITIFRKVNKCYRGHGCPIIVHCNNGVGRTGTYILLDMVLNKMIKGAKEMDIAASLEHIRDQRSDMVKTKVQFSYIGFVLF